ncbi:hypothetical protein Dimus_003518 [Dionaea muscipula]
MMSNWWEKMVFPLRRVWLSVSSRVKPPRSAFQHVWKQNRNKSRFRDERPIAITGNSWWPPRSERLLVFSVFEDDTPVATMGNLWWSLQS